MAGKPGMFANRSRVAEIAVRKKIQGAQIITALQNHVIGGKEMSATQVTAALGLLRKVVPDLTATTLSGDPDHPLEHRHFAGLVESKLFQDAPAESATTELVKLNGHGAG